MSDRHEWIDAKLCPVEMARPGDEVGYHIVEDHALIIGDPEGTALVVEGTEAQLLAFTQRLSALGRTSARG